MKDILKRLISILFAFVFVISSTTFILHTEKLFASETNDSVLLDKVSRS